jgi:hypothetical protein
MPEQPVRNQIVHRWYTRPVLFVADVNRANVVGAFSSDKSIQVLF